MGLVEVRRRLDEERRHLVRGGETVIVLPRVTRVRHGSEHHVAYSSLTAGEADAAIADEIEHHRRLGVAFEWKAYAHDGPAELPQRLERHGLTVGPREAVLVYDLAMTAAWADHDAPCTVVRIDRPDQVEDYRRVTMGAFGRVHASAAAQLTAALDDPLPEVRGYVAYVGTEPVSVGRLYTHPDSHFAGLYGGGTRPEHRGRGHYRAVVAARAHDAIASGARYLIVDAMPTSRPILERLGFSWLTDTWPCEWRPHAQ